jgi:hypothetical protein
MFYTLNIIEKFIMIMCNLLNIQCKTQIYQCCILTVDDNPAYGKHIALEQGNYYKKRSY